MKRKLIVATGNQHKLKEIAQIFTDFEIVSQKQAGFDGEVDETGETFIENALIKARAVTDALGCMALADDSGVCVPSLGGAPGVHSARYAGEHGNDKKNRDLLLENLKDKTDRSAYFACAVALTFPGGGQLTAEGKTHGRILTEERGEGGFGYDCIFYSEDLKKSFGEASAEEKNTVSHRYRALQALLEKWNTVEK